MVQVKVFTFNLFAENTFVIWDDETKEASFRQSKIGIALGWVTYEIKIS